MHLADASICVSVNDLALLLYGSFEGHVAHVRSEVNRLWRLRLNGPAVIRGCLPSLSVLLYLELYGSAGKPRYSAGIVYFIGQTSLAHVCLASGPCEIQIRPLIPPQLQKAGVNGNARDCCLVPELLGPNGCRAAAGLGPGLSRKHDSHAPPLPTNRWWCQRRPSCATPWACMQCPVCRREHLVGASHVSAPNALVPQALVSKL